LEKLKAEIAGSGSVPTGTLQAHITSMLRLPGCRWTMPACFRDTDETELVPPGIRGCGGEKHVEGI